MNYSKLIFINTLQIQDTEWAHANSNLKFNAVVTTYEILLKDKVSEGTCSLPLSSIMT